MEKVLIYQVFTRLFGNTKTKCKLNGSREGNGVGKMNDFSNKALHGIKELGITHVWYTGIIAHARCEGNPEFGLSNGNPKIIKGRAGSPYAITDYYDINADLAESIPNRIEEFEQLVKRTHSIGLKVIIDFVPNHVARQYNSLICPEKSFGLNDDTNVAFAPNNDYYYLPNESLELPHDTGTILAIDGDVNYSEKPAKVTGNDQFVSNISKNDWYETIKLNYGVDYLNSNTKYFNPIPPLWDKMLDILKYWANKGVEGFRCDMAEMVPVEFWNYAINEVKKEYPDVLFIAEVYNPDQYESYIKDGKFDYLYDKVGLYDTLRRIITDGCSTQELTNCWQSKSDLGDNMLSFLENHDEQRIASEYFAIDPLKAIPAMMVCATMNNGAAMIYFGQEVGEPAIVDSGYSGNDGRTTIFDYFNVPEHQKWMNHGNFDGGGLSIQQKELREHYKSILNFAKNIPAFAQGNFYDLMWANTFTSATNSTKLYAFLRYCEDSKALVIVNFDIDKAQEFVLKIPNEALIELKVLDKKAITLNGIFGDNRSFNVLISEIEQRGIWFNVLAHSSKVFQIST